MSDFDDAFDVLVLTEPDWMSLNAGQSRASDQQLLLSLSCCSDSKYNEQGDEWLEI